MRVISHGGLFIYQQLIYIITVACSNKKCSIHLVGVTNVAVQSKHYIARPIVSFSLNLLVHFKISIRLYKNEKGGAFVTERFKKKVRSGFCSLSF
jgi:hypothetical protein